MKDYKQRKLISKERIRPGGMYSCEMKHQQELRKPQKAILAFLEKKKQNKNNLNSRIQDCWDGVVTAKANNLN